MEKKFYPEEHIKIGRVQEGNMTEMSRRRQIVEDYLRKQENESGQSRKEILRQYIKKYYPDFLDQPMVEIMKSKERMDFLFDVIYKHEIVREKKDGGQYERAA